MIWRRHLPEFYRRYQLRTNLSAEDPAKLWQLYKLVEIEAPFKNLKDDLQLRPIHHQLEQRIETPPCAPNSSHWPPASPRRPCSRHSDAPTTCSGDFQGAGIDFIHFSSPIG
jgi:hypothetical protein